MNLVSTVLATMPESQRAHEQPRDRRSLRILWLSQLVPYPPKGGVLQRSYNLLRETARYHEIDLLAFNQRALMRAYYPSEGEGIADAERALAPLTRRMRFVDTPCDRLRGGKHLLALGSLVTRDPYTVNWQKSPGFARLCRDWARSGDYDLVHFDTIGLAQYRGLFAGIPRTLGHHNVESHLLGRRAEHAQGPMQWYLGQEARRLARYEHAACRDFSLNITCSELDRTRLQEVAPGCVTAVVPNGVDLEYFTPTGMPEQQRVVFAGMLNWAPNRRAVEYIADEIWPRLKARRPGVKVDIVGPNPPEAALARARRDRDFVVHGFVDDVRPYLEAASVYLCPIRDGGGTKLKLLDAFAMGKAVVADAIACEGLDVEAGRHVLLVDSPDAYVDWTERLLDDAGLRHDIGRRAARFVQTRYSFAAIGRSLAELFEQTAASRAPQVAETAG